MEIDANGDVEQRERSVTTGGRKGEFTILIAAPKDAALGKLHHLPSFKGLALSGIRCIERELNLLTADNANTDIRLGLETLNVEH